MKTLRLQKHFAPLAVLAYLCSFMLMPVASAGVIGTQAMLESEARSARIEHVQQMLSQDSVQEQLVALGVDPLVAKQRVASLTDAELQQIEGRMEELPAGGILAVLGIIFVVLLVLELVGAINLFNRV